jgi:hypothetical protein
MMREGIYGAGLSIFLSPYPKISAIASGATPIGSAVAHPIRKMSTKERRQVEAGNKEQINGHEVQT